VGRLSDQVVAILRTAIIRGDYPPGSRLPTANALSDTLGVSVSVVRDALRTLSSMGLVEVRHGHGIFAAQPRDDTLSSALALRMQRSELTVSDVLAARISIEGAFAAEAARTADEGSWRIMREALESFEQHVLHHDRPAAHLAHLGFHLSVLSALRLPALDLMLHPLQELIIVSSMPTQPGRTDQWNIDEHRTVLGAIESGDPETARAAVHAHFDFASRPQYQEFGQTLFRDVRAVATEYIGMDTAATPVDAQTS
jgi:GntR family transcriptional regulator, transcriptional repressor for pyruvate dehydrogenase complex